MTCSNGAQSSLRPGRLTLESLAAQTNKINMASMSKAGDPRLGSIFVQDARGGEIVLVGYPSDVGCRRNGGRVGAALGPEYFRSD